MHPPNVFVEKKIVISIQPMYANIHLLQHTLGTYILNITNFFA